MKTTSKAILLLAILLTTAIAAMGQEVTTSQMKGIMPGMHIKIAMDFSKATIMGMSEKDFSAYEPDWENDKPVVVSRFVKGMNNRLDEVLRIGSYDDTGYTLTVSVRAVSDVGNFLFDAALVSDDGTTLLAVKDVTGGKEPPFLPGTKLAKMKAWALLAGRSLGAIVRREYLAE